MYDVNGGVFVRTSLNIRNVVHDTTALIMPFISVTYKMCNKFINGTWFSELDSWSKTVSLKHKMLQRPVSAPEGERPQAHCTDTKCISARMNTELYYIVHAYNTRHIISTNACLSISASGHHNTAQYRYCKFKRVISRPTGRSRFLIP